MIEKNRKRICKWANFFLVFSLKNKILIFDYENCDSNYEYEKRESQFFSFVFAQIEKENKRQKCNILILINYMYSIKIMSKLNEK